MLKRLYVSEYNTCKCERDIGHLTSHPPSFYYKSQGGMNALSLSRRRQIMLLCIDDCDEHHVSLTVIFYHRLCDTL